MLSSSLYIRTHCKPEHFLRQDPLSDRIEAHFARIEEILHENHFSGNCRHTSLFVNKRRQDEHYKHFQVNHRGNRRQVRHLDRDNSSQDSSIAKSYSSFLIWIYIWDIIKLMKMSSAGEVLKNVWIEKINRIQARISLEIRTHRGIRNVSRSIRLPFHIQGRG